MKEHITTIKPDELENHVIWLFKLTPRQARVVVKMLGEIWQPDYWYGVNKHEVRWIIESYARRIGK
jgi:hypothetical protein